MNKSFKDGLQFAWDSTSIKLADECLRKYQYKMLEGWSPRGKSVHLLFGGWYATALEHFYKHVALGMGKEEATLEVVHEALINSWEYPQCETCEGEGETMIAVCHGGVHSETTGSCPDCEGLGYHRGGKPWQSDHNTKTRENLIRTIVWYLDHFAEEPLLPITLSDGRPAVEYSFSLPVDNGLVFSGHIDRLVTYGGHHYVVDQKTSGSTLSAHYFDQFSPDTQMSLYTFAGKMIYNLPVKGVIIDAAQIAVGFTQFSRGFTFRSDAQLGEWYNNAMVSIERARNATQDFIAEGKPMPMNTTACGNYGGCEFRRVCARDPEHRASVLAGDFTKGPSWDPLSKR